MSPAILIKKLEEAIRAEYQTADFRALSIMRALYDLDYIDAARRVLSELKEGHPTGAQGELREFVITFLGSQSEFRIDVGLRIQALYDASRRAVDAALAETVPAEVPLDLNDF